MAVVHGSPYSPMDGDPDDYRPGSAWSLHVDPERRTQLSVIRESIGVGDRIPRHWHDIDEVVLYEKGVARVFLDGVETDVRAGATLFIPAGALHGTMNIGDEPVEIRAVYPSTVVRMSMVERNPKPGTEDQAPRVSVYDMATGRFTIVAETEIPPAPR